MSEERAAAEIRKTVATIATHPVDTTRGISPVRRSRDSPPDRRALVVATAPNRPGEKRTLRVRIMYNEYQDEYFNRLADEFEQARARYSQEVFFGDDDRRALRQIMKDAGGI